MHSHFRVSWGYDTVMTKGRMTPGEGGNHVTQFTENQRALHA